MWRAKSPDVIKPLLHTGQIWSRIPVWIFLWAWKLPSAANCFEHTDWFNAKYVPLEMHSILFRKTIEIVYLHIVMAVHPYAFACVLLNYVFVQIDVYMYCTDKNMVFLLKIWFIFVIVYGRWLQMNQVNAYLCVFCNNKRKSKLIHVKLIVCVCNWKSSLSDIKLYVLT